MNFLLFLPLSCPPIVLLALLLFLLFGLLPFILFSPLATSPLLAASPCLSKPSSLILPIFSTSPPSIGSIFYYCPGSSQSWSSTNTCCKLAWPIISLSIYLANLSPPNFSHVTQQPIYPPLPLMVLKSATTRTNSDLLLGSGWVLGFGSISHISG